MVSRRKYTETDKIGTIKRAEIDFFGTKRILIIERTSTIGLLRSLGATSTLVRRVFLWLAVFLIGRGMLWGDVVMLLGPSYLIARIRPADSMRYE